MFKKLCIIYIRVHWVRLAVATEQTRNSTQKPNLGFCGGYRPLESNGFQVRITHNSISNCFVKLKNKINELSHMNIVMKNLVTQTLLRIKNISAYKRIPKTSEYKDLCLVLSICDGLIHGGGGYIWMAFDVRK